MSILPLLPLFAAVVIASPAPSMRPSPAPSVRPAPHAITDAWIREAAPGVEVIIMDVEMPGPDGIETCRRLKAAPRLRDIPVLIVTGNPQDETLEAAFAAGACDFLAKPVQATELLARLQDEHPDRYPDKLLRTLQRRVRDWRREIAHALVFGPSSVGGPLMPAATTMVPSRPAHPADVATISAGNTG